MTGADQGEAGPDRRVKSKARGRRGPSNWVQLVGGRATVQRLLDRFRMVSFAASLAGVETTVSHPEVTSHRYLSSEERAALGIHPGTLRISAGIEEADDIIEDFLQALGS